MGDLIDAVNDMSMKIKQSEKMKSEFISSVSHELRTPLTAINGWAETIMNGEVRDASDVKKGMGIIVSEARRLTNMVEELLEFSRIEDGRFTLSVEPMDIKAELEDAVYTYTEFFRREGITLTHTDCEEEFPPIPGDPERTMGPVSRRRSSPTSNTSFTKAAPRPEGPGSALRCARRSSPGTTVAWILATLRAEGASSPSACRSAAEG